MRSNPWRQRFFATTRGNVVALLRRGTHTVNELAEALGVSANALRNHLAALERDGLIEQRGVQRGARKPSAVYGLSHAAEALFPHGYGLILGSLLDAMAERLAPAERDALLEAAGRRCAAAPGLRAGAPAPVTGEPRARLEAALAVFAELGGLAEVAEEDGRVFLRGFGCPLAQVTGEHPETCRLAAAMLSELAGLRVVERCERGDRPACRFELDDAGRTAGTGT